MQDHVTLQGLTIINGAVSFANVTLTFLELRAIQVTNPNAILSLSNVTITTALIPCIVLLDRARITLSNVTVMGEVISPDSPYIHYIADEGTTPSENTTKVKADHPACTDSDTTLTCDFENTTQVSKAKIKQIKILYNRTVEFVPTHIKIRFYLHMAV